MSWVSLPYNWCFWECLLRPVWQERIPVTVSSYRLHSWRSLCKEEGCIFSFPPSPTTFSLIQTACEVGIEAVRVVLAGFNSALFDSGSELWAPHRLGVRAADQRLCGQLTTLVRFQAVLWHSLFLCGHYSTSHLELIDSVAPLTDVDVVNPDEKSIMTYVAQFLQYSKDAAEAGERAQVCPYKYDSSAFLLYPTDGLIFKTEV